VPEDFALQFPSESREFNVADALYDKAMLSPIPTGGKIRGVLWFQVEQVNASVINKVGTIFGLWFKDSFGHLHTAICTISRSGKTLPTFFPGLRN